MLALTNNEWTLVIAVIVFCISGVLCFAKDATLNTISRSLLSLGLAIFALSFIVNP